MPEVIWIALIGAITGLAAGLGGAYITVRAQARQADRERWAHRRHEAYADVLLAAGELSALTSDWWAGASVGVERGDDLPESMGTAATDAYDRASVRAELIASWRGHVKPRLNMLDHAVWTARFSTYRMDSQSPQDVVDAVELARRELDEAKGKFARAARVELGVDREGIMSPWRARWYKIRKRLRRPPRKPDPGSTS